MKGAGNSRLQPPHNAAATEIKLELPPPATQTTTTKTKKAAAAAAAAARGGGGGGGGGGGSSYRPTMTEIRFDSGGLPVGFMFETPPTLAAGTQRHTVCFHNI